jgi:hypothetical protein
MSIPDFHARHEHYRRNWVQFLRRTVPDIIWRQLASTDPARNDSRVCWVPSYLILAWLVIGWSARTSLSERLAEACRWLARRFPARWRPGQTYAGLVKATQRVGQDLFQRFWRFLRPRVLQRLGHARSWYGWTVLAADGSRIDAPRTRANARRLGRAGRNHTGPQWWVTWLIHLPTGLVWDWRQGPGNSSERRHLAHMIDDLPRQTLLVADAGYVGFDLMRRLAESGADFLIRCGSNVRLLVEDTRQQIERDGQSQRVYLWPMNRRYAPPLVLRLIVLKRNGKRVYLLTTVREVARLSRQMASQIYAARWSIEVGFRSLKRTLGHYRVRSKTPAAGAMELAAYVLALAMLMLEGALVLGRQVVRLSVAAALRALRDALEALLNRGWAAPLEQMLRAALRDDYRRRRSKRSRYWPRKKNDHPPGPPKLQRLTRHEISQITAIIKQFSTVLG